MYVLDVCQGTAETGIVIIWRTVKSVPLVGPTPYLKPDLSSERAVTPAGHWKKEEEEELTRIVTEMTTNQGKDFDNDVFWGQVAERMGNKRGRQQCRIKW